MKKNDLCNFKNLEKSEKIGFISVFLLLFSFIFILLFTNYDKVFGLTETEVLDSPIFFASKTSTTEHIESKDLLICYKTIHENDITSKNFTSRHTLISMIVNHYQSHINTHYETFLPEYTCVNYDIPDFEGGYIGSAVFPKAQMSYFDWDKTNASGVPLPIEYGLYFDSEPLDLGYTYFGSNDYGVPYTIQNLIDYTLNEPYYDGYKQGYLDASSDPKAITDYLRDSSLNIDLETEVNGVKNEIIGNLYYQNIDSVRINVDDFVFSGRVFVSNSNYAFTIPFDYDYNSLVLNNVNQLNDIHSSVFGSSYFLRFGNYASLGDFNILGNQASNSNIFYLLNNKKELYFFSRNTTKWCASGYASGCSTVSNASASFKKFMTDGNIDYLDFSYVLSTPIIYDLSNADFDFLNYDKGFSNGQEIGFSNGFNVGQQDGINTMSGSWISNLFVGLGALFSIAIAPNITIGMIAMIPIVLALVPFVIGLATGKRGRD